MADREDFATAVGGLIKNHTHHRLDNPYGYLTLDASGGLQQWVDGTRRWWVDGTGTVREGTTPIAQVPGLRAELDALEYDSGIRNLNSLFGITSGTAIWQYRSGWAYLAFENAVPTVGANGVVTAAGLASVAPVQNAPAPGVLFSDTGGARRAHLSYIGQVRIYGYVTGEKITGSIVYPMNRAVPTTLPGSPA